MRCRLPPPNSPVNADARKHRAAQGFVGVRRLQGTLGSHLKGDHGELVERRGEEEDEALPGIPATITTTAPEPRAARRNESKR